MSQRNPMNDRYQDDDRKGQTRKSAARAKPKTKAAATVRVVSNTKTPKQKKAEKRAQQQKQRQVEGQYYKPDTPEYKKWRKIWWICLIGAIVGTAGSFLIRYLMPENETVSLIVLGIAYVGIISALIIDFTKIRKIRKAYQVEMQSKITKDQRALEKQQHAEALAAKKAAAEAAAKEEDQGPITQTPRKGFLSFSGLRGLAGKASQANKQAAAKAGSETTDSDTKGK